MSTMTSFQGHNLANTFLTENEIRRRCPYAFETSPTSEFVSDRYVTMTSMDVVRDLEKLDWYVVEAKQRKAQKNKEGEKSRFSYHQVWFQNPNICITRNEGGEEVVDCYPRIILTNSADGLNCLKFGVGLYRLVCSNGLVIADEKLAEFSVRHINYTFEYVRTVIERIVAELPNQVAVMNHMRTVELNGDQKLEFAKRAWALRLGKDVNEIEEDDETFEDMLTPVREEDKGNTLWDVYNVLQEKVVKGGFQSARKDDQAKVRKVRKITSFITETNLSREVDKLAREYLPIPVEAA